MKSSKLTHTLCRFALPSAIVAGGMLTSCEDDLLTGTPSWLGSSIYAELEQRGNFTQELALINDPALSEYPRILQLTGSKTLFVADDDAWAEFFKNNKWGARSFADLTTAQKQMLLKSSMIDNAYLIELLSNKAGNPPEEGGCVRRESSASLYDSIPHVATADLPQTPQWNHLQATKDSIYLFPAQSLGDVPPMLHFLPDYMKTNNFTDEDVKVITNGVLTSTSGCYVNGMKVRENDGSAINRDITCQNGYIHIVEGVPYQLENMAELIAGKPQLSTFSSMLERYSTPQGVSLLNHDDGTQDSLYVKRYLNNAKNSQYVTSSTPAQPILKEEVLSMDPGWNNFVLDNQNNITYVSDAGCVLAPTDEALAYYAAHGGKPLMDRFGSWDNVPLGTLNKLINNHMQTSMKTVVPSKFYAVTNTAGDSLGLTIDAVDSCFVACNGLVYQINRVFVAPEYEAVSFPTQVRQDLSVSKYASESTNALLNFNAYLTSTSSKYGFIIPNDNAYLNYVPPTNNLTATTSTRWEISIVDDGKNKSLRGRQYVTNLNTGRVTQSDIKEAFVIRALRDIMRNHIIVLDSEKMFTDQQKIYTTMAGGPVRIENAGTWANLETEDHHAITAAGSELMEMGTAMDVDSVYIMGNGVSMVVTETPLHTTSTTPYAALADSLTHPEYKAFFELVDGSSLKTGKHVEGSTERDGLGSVISLFNNYHYTMFVPRSSSIYALQEKGLLPNWNDVKLMENFADPKKRPDESDSLYGASLARFEEMKALYGFTLPDMDDNSYYKRMNTVADSLTQRIEDFVCYHVQDNALYLEGAEQKDMPYETSCLDPLITEKDEEGNDIVTGGTGRYRKLRVNYDYNNMTVTPVWSIVEKDPATGKSKTRVEVKTELARTVNPGPNSNVVTRQYVFNTGSDSDASGTKNAYVYSSSYVVIHEIDEPLFYESAQFNKQ